MSETTERFLEDSMFQLLHRIVASYSLVRIVFGKVEVDWNKFVEFEMEAVKKEDHFIIPEIFEGRAKNLFEKFLYLLCLLGIISRENLNFCYLLKGEHEDETYSLEWGFIRERDAKAYCDLIKQKFPDDFKWEIIPPKDGPIVSEDALVLEKNLTRSIDALFAQMIAEVVDFKVAGIAIIDFRRLFELESSSQDGSTSEIVQRIWDRLEMMKFVTENPLGGFEINLKPKKGSDREKFCLNPKCLGTIRYFTQECDAITWSMLLVEKNPEYDEQIEINQIESTESDNGEHFFEGITEEDIDGGVDIDTTEGESDDEGE